jgi:RNA-dependent RNA polymerase
MVLFKACEEERINRVVRKYKDNIENFLKVSFTDDKEEKNFYLDDKKYLLNNIYNVLVEGISISADFHFAKLSYSNSQIKEHSLWFLCEDPQKGLVKQDILGSLGDFDKEKNILKQFARIGQFFSTTRHIKRLQPEDISSVDDVKNTDPSTGAEYCMTDGGGLISKQLADEINEQYGLDECSAYQIRLGGCKGVLLVDPSLKGNQVVLRKSMIKFNSTSTDLEIIRCATWSQGSLNRQIIMLLVSLGVPEEIFLDI